MEVVKCAICGGELDVNTDMTMGECQYCGSKIIIPKNLDKIGNLYNRANYLRQNKEFYQAMAVYEEILREDNTDAEAHWGLVLSKYGIEFVKDSMSGKYLPTCHRTQNISVLSDADYKAAIEFADSIVKTVYEERAKEIARVQARIQEISKKEEPYDVFICYKEKDERGNRTEDSVLAQDIYHALEKEGYRVFFARKTLESKLGSEYEPIIFNALLSAKVMLVAGTKAEHYTSTWVRNEWSRYIAMNADGDKTIIPIYKGISPYDLPLELSNLQGLDMSKIGFLQDLLDGLRKILNKRDKTTEVSSKSNDSKVVEESRVDILNKNAEAYLHFGDVDKAEMIYAEMTETYAFDYRGWWGRIVCVTSEFTKVPEVSSNAEENRMNCMCKKWYTNACKLAKGDKLKEIQSIYEKYIDKVVRQKSDDEWKVYEFQLKILKDELEENSKEEIEQEKKKENISRKRAELDSEYEKRLKTQKTQFRLGVKRVIALLGIIAVISFIGVSISAGFVMGIMPLIFWGGLSLVIGLIEDARVQDVNNAIEFEWQSDIEELIEPKEKMIVDEIKKLAMTKQELEDKIARIDKIVGMGKTALEHNWAMKVRREFIGDVPEEICETDQEYMLVEKARNDMIHIEDMEYIEEEGNDLDSLMLKSGMEVNFYEGI